MINLIRVIAVLNFITIINLPANDEIRGDVIKKCEHLPISGECGFSYTPGYSQDPVQTSNQKTCRISYYPWDNKTQRIDSKNKISETFYTNCGTCTEIFLTEDDKRGRDKNINLSTEGPLYKVSKLRCKGYPFIDQVPSSKKDTYNFSIETLAGCQEDTKFLIFHKCK